MAKRTEKNPARNRLVEAKLKGRTLAFRAVFTREGRWFLGSTPDVTGAISQERTLTKARTSLAEAVRDLVELDPR